MAPKLFRGIAQFVRDNLSGDYVSRACFIINARNEEESGPVITAKELYTASVQKKKARNPRTTAARFHDVKSRFAA